MRYDHNNYGHRFLLAASIISRLEDNKFEEVDNDSFGEVTMQRVSECSKFKIVVYTTVNKTDRMTRSIGKDAIRVQLLKVIGKCSIPIEKTSKILRVGEIESISDRIIDSVKKLAAFSKESKSKVCEKCGEHKFLSKKNNWVCSNFCWTK